MIKELNTELRYDKWYLKGVSKVLDYLETQIKPGSYVLDMGEPNLFTKLLKDRIDIEVCNTRGDLDESFIAPLRDYDIVIYSHVIEHQFNPLYTLLELKKHITDQTILFIGLPERGKLLWTPIHYHEIDEYRMGLLLKRAGYEILEKRKFVLTRRPGYYLTGIRPLMRLFLEHQVYYKVKIKAETK